MTANNETNPTANPVENRTGANDSTNPIKDSGHRRSFSTGAQRDRAAGKGQPVLISPIFIRRLALHMEHGAAKYERRNWEKGFPVEECIDSAFRHLLAIIEGKTDEDHEAACAFNIMAVIHTREMIRRGILPKELDYKPAYEFPLPGTIVPGKGTAVQFGISAPHLKEQPRCADCGNIIPSDGPYLMRDENSMKYICGRCDNIQRI
jgi:hypothetical protein